MIRIRSALSADVIQNNIHVRMNMPTMDSFNPIPSLNHWFTLSNRHGRTNGKAKQQEWFHGVFREASSTWENHDRADDISLDLEALQEDDELKNFEVQF